MIYRIEELAAAGMMRPEGWGWELTQLLRRPGPGAGPSLVLTPEFLRTWLRAGGLEERLLLAIHRLPSDPEPLELWDLWLSLQAALLRGALPEAHAEALRLRLSDLPAGGLEVCASLPPGAAPGLQGSLCGLRGLESVLEAVRLSWAAVLCAQPDPARLPEVAGAVLVRPDGQPPLRREAAWATAENAGSRSTPAVDLLRLGETYGRLFAPGAGPGLPALLDLDTGEGAGTAGEPLAASGVDREAQEQFLLRALAAGLIEAGELLGRAREAWKRWAGRPAPHRRSFGPAPGPEQFGIRQLVGTAAWPGLARGPARVVHDTGLPPGAHAALRPGEVLVCRAVETSLRSAALAAAGLVTEQGGTLSHGAVLAARAGIPCVCGVRDATRLIRTGEILVLEGHLRIVGTQRFR